MERKLMIAPSMGCCDLFDMERQVRIIDEKSDFLHMDIKDGVYVPSFGIGPEFLAALKDKVSTPMDAHLMIKHPQQYLETFAKAGAAYITPHTDCIEGDAFVTINKIKELGYTPGLQPEADYYAVKMPVFSFEKIRDADISLGPEMKSTGECLGIAKTFDEALYKAFLGAGIKLPKFSNMIMTVRDEDKDEAVEIGKRFEKIGYKIFATKGTAEALTEAGVKAIAVNKIEQSTPNLMDLILGHKIDLVIDTPPQGAEHSKDGFVIRRSAIETGVNVLTAIDTAKALITSLENTDIQKLTLVDIAKIQAV